MCVQEIQTNVERSMQTLMAAGSAIGQRMMSMVSRWATVMMGMGMVMMMMLSPGPRGCCSQPSQLARPAPLQLPVSCTANTRTSRTSQTATATSVRLSEYIHPCYNVIYPPVPGSGSVSAAAGQFQPYTDNSLSSYGAPAAPVLDTYGSPAAPPAPEYSPPQHRWVTCHGSREAV